MKLIIGVTGASGVIHAVRLLETLSRFPDTEAHLIMSEWAEQNLALETTVKPAYMESLAAAVYKNSDLAAAPSSGSFRTDGMIIIPCSMNTLASISCGLCSTLITRSAAVCLKEGRKLVLCPRETPLDAIQLENMLKLARMGVRIVPPMPAYYNHPATIDDLIQAHVMKVLDQFGIDTAAVPRWNGSESEHCQFKEIPAYERFTDRD
jgi:polyprenyl P-hydroxybenzoate/phenylacrylic acid decarboxylase-like protein